ncbi:MAG: hypothetical protein HQ522_05450 [Bacteroidetes bacterium]|nr:hypothetical protein [Bacteroidota bacterium]
MGETTRVYGKIIEVFPSREVKTFRRRVKYVYAANDKFYFDFINLGTQDKKQAIGNTVQISYSKKNPQNNKVDKFLSDYKNSNAEKYYSIKETGYIEVRLINGIFKYKEYAEKGKIVDNFVGEYLIENDTFHFKQYNFRTDTILINKLELLVVDSKNINQLIETDTNMIFKKIKNSR